MNDRLLVCGSQPVGDLHRILDRLSDRQRSDSERSRSVRPSSSSDTMTVEPCSRPMPYTPKMLGVIERRGRSRFLLEAMKPIGVG